MALLTMLSLNHQRPLDTLQPRNADFELSTYETFQTAFCVSVEESLSAIQSRVSDLDNPYHGKSRSDGKRRGGTTAYGGIFPLEEVTDMIFRSMNPVGDVDAASPGSLYSATTATGSTRQLTAGVDFHGAKLASRGDLADRFASLVDFAINVLVFGPKATENRNTLAVSLLSLMITEVQLGWENPKRKSILSNSQKLRKRLLVLTNACLSPNSTLEMRLKAVRIINNQFRTTDLLKHLFEGQQAMAFTFVLYIEDLLLNHKDGMPVDDIIGCKQFFDFIQTCGVSKMENSGDREYSHSRLQDRRGLEESDATKKNRVRLELNKLASQSVKGRSSFITRCQEKARRYYNNLEGQEKSLTKSATAVTNVAMQLQASERKAFMADMRYNLGEKVKALQHWQDIVERHTHDRAIWFFPDLAPKSWGLSETEGAQRMRIKMRRCHTKLPPKCYLQESKHKASCSIEEEKEGPFGFLSKGNGRLSGVIIEQLRTDHSIRFMEDATLVLHDKEIKGEVLVSKTAIYFVQQPEHEEDGQVASYDSHKHSPTTYSWNMDTVREIHRRWYQLSAVAVEVFFSTSSTTRFFAFRDSRRRDSFIRSLVDCQPRLSNLPHPDHIMELWQDGAITNFDYLMQLNKLAGRTFHDLMQYPVFPFILADYESDNLDLYVPSSFRDLRRPIAVQSAESEERYVNNYKVLSQQELEQMSEDSSVANTSIGPFHYGSHYSNAGVVLHFLVRVPPFTNMFLRFQDGSFDIPDRSFHSMANTWRLSSRDSASDVKELIPDLFCLPEMLTNFEGLDFGEKQDGDQVADVILPPWAKGSPRMFMKVHRQALESEYVREHLCHWIDLVFGYKQKGKEAVAAVNVFHPSTYYGFDINTIEDPVLRAARATMIKTYGQTPKQLFHLPHPMVTRNPAEIPATADPPDVPKILEQVHGLQWGDYVGSPSQAPPAIVLKVSQPKGTASFVALANNEVYGLPSNTTLVSRYVQEAPATSLGVQWQFSVAGAALLCYGHPDGIVRARLRKTMPPEPFFNPSEEVTLMQTYPDGSRVWIAYKSGKIDVIGLDFRPRDLSLVSTDEKFSLFAHTERLNSLDLCPEFSIAVSGSQDGTAVIWDLKSVSYVRTLHHEGPVKIVAASKTSGDLATISSTHDSGTKNRLSLFSVNGTLAAAEICHPAVSSLTFSSSPEGVSCNVVATGHINGVVRLWNSWDLSRVRDVDTTQTSPIVSLCWSPDCQNLYTSTESGELIVFEKSDVTGMGNAPRYVNLTPMA